MWGTAHLKERKVGTRMLLICNEGYSIVGREAICVSGEDPEVGEWKGATSCVSLTIKTLNFTKMNRVFIIFEHQTDRSRMIMKNY